MKRNKIIIPVLVLFIITLAIIWGIKVRQVNNTQRDNKQEDIIVRAGEELKLDGVTYKVKDIEVYDFKQFVYEYPELGWITSSNRNTILLGNDESKDMKMLLYTVEFILDDADSRYNLPNHVRSVDNTIDTIYEYYLFTAMNEFPDGLVPGQLYSRKVPVLLYDEMFSKAGWSCLEEKDTKLKLVLGYAPKEYNIMLDASVYKKNTDDALAYYETIYEKASALTDAVLEPDEPLDTNVFYDGYGYYDDLLKFEIVDSCCMTKEELWSLPEAGDVNRACVEDGEDLAYCIKMKITNTCDDLLVYNVGNMALCFFENDECYDYTCDVVYSSGQQNENTKSVYEYSLAAGETMEHLIVFDFVLEGNRGQEIKRRVEERDEFYFCYNPMGATIDKLSNRMFLYMKID